MLDFPSGKAEAAPGLFAFWSHVATNFTTDDLARIDKAIGQGVLSVKFADGRQVDFSTFQELVSRRNFIAQELGQTAGRQRLLAKFKKGLSS